MRELLSSEQVYVDSLGKLIDLFYRPLTGRAAEEQSRGSFRAPGGSSRDASMLSKGDADVLFGQVEVIALYNTRLLQDLKDRLDAPTYRPEQECISEVFVKMKSFLQVYVGYSENYPKAMQVYEAIMARNSKTRKILKAAEKEAGNVLEAFLILPIQRIPRYILLLKEIVKFTDPSHPDYRSLTETIDTIKDLCSAINDAPKRLQEANEMLSVYKRLVPSLPDLIAPGRHVVSQTRVWIINDDGAVKSRILFVFNDMLLVTRPESERFYLRFRIALPNVEVVDSPAVDLGGKKAHIITLEARQKKIVLAFKEQEEKTQLMEDISKFNPTIVCGAPGFLPLESRPHMLLEQSKSASAPTMKSRRASVSLDGVDVRKGLAAAAEKEEAAGAKFSGLLTRKKTVGTPQGSRKSVKSPPPGEFEIVRTDAPLSSSPTGPGMAAAAAKPAADAKLAAAIAQKTEEQRDLQKLLQFYRKCDDKEGVAEATASIARNEAELAELRAQQAGKAAAPEAEGSGKKRLQHARKRSMSTSSLPKFVDGDFAPPQSAPAQQPPKSPARLAERGAPSTTVGLAPPPPLVAVATAARASSANVAPVARVSAAAAAAPAPKKGSYALYDFTGVNEGELTCKQGDSLEVQSENGDWLLCAHVATGKQGWLPKSECTCPSFWNVFSHHYSNQATVFAGRPRTPLTTTEHRNELLHGSAYLV